MRIDNGQPFGFGEGGRSDGGGAESGEEFATVHGRLLRAKQRQRWEVSAFYDSGRTTASNFLLGFFGRLDHNRPSSSCRPG